MTGSNKLENGQQTSQFGLETQAIRAGHQRTGEGEHGEPILLLPVSYLKMQKKRQHDFLGISLAMSIRVLPTQQCVLLNSDSVPWRVGIMLWLRHLEWQHC
jgi:hypothetical protein